MDLSKLTKEEQEDREKLLKLLPELEKGKTQFQDEESEEEKAARDRLVTVKNDKVVIPNAGDRKSFLSHKYKGYDISRAGRCLGKDFNDAERELIAKWFIDVLMAKKQYNSVDADFRDYMKSVEKATMVEGTGSLGGYGVFDKYDSTLWGLAAYATPILGLADTQVVGGKTFNITSELTAPTAYFTNENAAFTESNMTLSTLQMNLNKLGFYTVATNELLEDFEWNFQDWLMMRGAEAFGRKIEYEVFQGTNFTKSFKAAALTNDVNVASLSALSYTHFSECISKLEPQLRANAKWYIHYENMHYVRTIKDSNNRPIFTEGFDKTAPGSIYGIPVQEMVGMPASDATSSDIVAILADMKNFKIYRRYNDIQLIIDPYSSATSWLTRFVLGTRIDGALVKPGACAQISLT